MRLRARFGRREYLCVNEKEWRFATLFHLRKGSLILRTTIADHEQRCRQREKGDDE